MEGDVVVQSPTWKEVELKKRILTTQKWTGTDPQLDRTIDKFIAAKYLARDDGSKLSITVRLLGWLLDHARGFHQGIFHRPGPGSWQRKKGDWLTFNEIIFKYLFDQIGKPWRDMRGEISRTISAQKSGGRSKKSDRVYTTDHMGEHPEYWLVVFIVGFAEKINEWEIINCAIKYKLQEYVKGTSDITTAVEKLCEYGILVRNEKFVQLTPSFEARMKDVIRAVDINIPKLKADCEAWRSSRQISVKK
jgi:hypothetical protein